jgi:hypothetical protein
MRRMGVGDAVPPKPLFLAVIPDKRVARRSGTDA